MAKRAKGTGTLRKRADGRWEGRLYLGKDENGKNQYKTVTSKKKSECQNKLDKLIAEEEKRKRNENCKYGDCINPTVEEWNQERSASSISMAMPTVKSWIVAEQEPSLSP